jgi:predicted nuclease of predicted toxin-antitoxin system
MVEFLIDANLPKRMAFWHDGSCEIVPDTQWHDSHIWRYARQHGPTVVTRDADFERLALLEGPPVVILLCVGMANRREIWQILNQWWTTAQAASRQPGCRMVRVYPDWIEVVATEAAG